MMNRAIAATCLVAASFPALAGWFQVTNYEGAIGPYRVHLSIQTFDWLNHNDPRERVKVVGSYYYDSRRVPIALHGTQQADGAMRLCEAQDVGAMMGRSPHSEDQLRKDPCPFLLTATDDGATGIWQDGKSKYDVRLKTVGKLDNTEKDTLVGKMEVPMWDHSSRHMYLGEYELRGEQLALRKVRAVNMATGKVEREADKLCDYEDSCLAGLIYTNIYENVRSTRNASTVSIGYGGGKMGSDEEVKLDSK
jgi:hypothetical protein